MIKTAFDIETIIYKIISANAAITSEINGGIYKKRPLNSRLEDIVVGTSPVTCDQIQTCSPYVNIHVPNLIVTSNGVQDNTQPNLKRLNELTKMVWVVVDEIYHVTPDDNYWFHIKEQNVLSNDNEQINEHYSNILLNFYSLNSTN